MRIELVSPANSDVTCQESRNTHSAALGLIAALTPKEHEVTLTEEHMGDEVVFRDDVDIVGITAMTKQAGRAYQIADEYRRRGKKVVLGGIHPSVLPDEAAAHADAVVVGEGELVWPEVLRDLSAGQSRGQYRADHLMPMQDVPAYRRDLFTKRATFSVNTVQATRGCPYDCEFCSANLFFGRTFRRRPVQQVVDEMRAAKGKDFFFSDDNILGNPKYARELFAALVPLGVRWVGQASLKLAVRDTELLKLARKSGCAGLFFGFESLDLNNQKDTKSFGKNGVHSLEELSAGIRLIHKHGILIMAAMVFGLDHDDKFVFEHTHDYLTKNRVALASLAICTPYPGTKLYERLHGEGRIFDYDWSHYDNDHVVYHPKRMTAEELQDGCDWISSEFFKPMNIAKKFWANRANPILYTGLAIGWYVHHRRHYAGRGVIRPSLVEPQSLVVGAEG